MQQAVDGKAQDDLVRKRVRRTAADGDLHAGRDAPRIERGGRLERFAGEHFGHTAARQHVDERFTGSDAVTPFLVEVLRVFRAQDLAGWLNGARRKRLDEGHNDDSEERHHGIRDGASTTKRH